MTESIKLRRGAFGHVSILNVASNFVTHAHFAAHIIIWLEGTAGVMTIGRETVRLGARLAAGINSFEAHSHAQLRDAEPGLFLAFYVDPDWVRRRRGLADHAPVFPRAAIPLDAGARAAAAALLRSLDGDDTPDFIAAYETERFIDSLIDAANVDAVAGAPAVRCHPRRDFRVRKALDLMRAHVGKRICFDEIARSVGLSRPHFFSLFKEQMNVTPNVYWNMLRMEEALRELECPEASLISVADSLGFTTQGNFSRFFRDHAGVPPRVYRSAVQAA
jgi:AraC family transcriptional regulator